MTAVGQPGRKQETLRL